MDKWQRLTPDGCSGINVWCKIIPGGNIVVLGYDPEDNPSHRLLITRDEYEKLKVLMENEDAS
jgi:hypothetical protein